MGNVPCVYCSSQLHLSGACPELQHGIQYPRKQTEEELAKDYAEYLGDGGRDGESEPMSYADFSRLRRELA